MSCQTSIQFYVSNCDKKYHQNEENSPDILEICIVIYLVLAPYLFKKRKAYFSMKENCKIMLNTQQGYTSDLSQGNRPTNQPPT